MRLDLKHPLGWIFKSIDVGFDYSDRKKVKSALVYFAYLNGNGCSTSNAASCATNPYNNTLYAPSTPLCSIRPSLAYVACRGRELHGARRTGQSVLSRSEHEFPNDYNRNYFC